MFKQDRDQFLFNELDKLAKNLRDAAKDLAEFLNQQGNQTNESRELIDALQKLTTIDIKGIDKGITNVKNAILNINVRDDSKNSFLESLNNDAINIFLKKQEILNKEVIVLYEKAMNLSKKHTKNN